MRRWWVAAAVFLVGGYGVVLLALIAVHAGGNWSDGAPSIVVPARELALVRGRGHAFGNTFVLDSLDPAGNAILAARIAPFPAEGYARVEWKLAADSAGEPSLAFLWRTREEPNRTRVKALHWADGRIVPLQLMAADGWSGTITGVGLAFRGAIAQPVVLESVTLVAPSAGSEVDQVLRQWTTRYPFKASSIAFPFDEERNDDLSLLAATALAQGLAIACYLVVARRRKWPFDSRVVWAVFLAGWLVLDARWQVNLWRELGDTAGTFSGKTTEEKHLAAVDHEFYTLMQEMRAALPAPPARVFFLADNASLRARGAFFLYPHSVNGFYADRRLGTRTASPDDLHAGDYVLLLLYSGARYDRAAKALVWPNGRQQPVAEALYKSDAIVLLRLL